MLSVAWLQLWSRRSVGLRESVLKVLQPVVRLDSGLLGLSRLACLPVAMGAAVMLAGCGETYRPVVTPVIVTGPAPQPQSYAVVTTTAGTTLPGLANVFDAPGDTLLTQALLGNGPLALSLSSTGTSATTANTDLTVNTYTPSTTLETKNIQSSTLLPGAKPLNLLYTATNLFITLPNVPAVAVLTNNSSGVYQLTQQLPVPASPINLAGNSSSVRVYSITQDNGSGTVAFGDCETPTAVTTPGQVQSIEIATATISRTLPVGICPVYGILRPTITGRSFSIGAAELSLLSIFRSTPSIPPQTCKIFIRPPARLRSRRRLGSRLPRSRPARCSPIIMPLHRSW